MRNLLMGSAALLALTVSSAPSQAVPIAAGSELSLSGSDTWTASASAFALHFINPSNIGGTNGSFAAALGVVPPQITGAATLDDFTNASTNFNLYSATANGATTTLTAAAISSFLFTPGGALEGLEVKGTGSLSLTGFETTAGFWDLTTQQPAGATGPTQAVVTFSETSVTAGVPEPNMLIAFAAAMLLITSIGMRRRHP